MLRSTSKGLSNYFLTKDNYRNFDEDTMTFLVVVFIYILQFVGLQNYYKERAFIKRRIHELKYNI